MLALLFPGQGSQNVGMGRALAEAFPEAQAVFDEVDEALGEKLSATIFDGPEDALTLTANAQPALMAVSMAALRAMQAQGFEVTRAQFVAGHSLGEYSALAAAKSLSIADAARLLRLRGEAMQAAVPVGEGAMAAIIGLDLEQVEAICAEAQGTVEVANDNGGGQVVISGEARAVEAAAQGAQAAGAKRALMLPVSAPFHSSLMGPAAERMREALGDAEIHATLVPLVANVTAEPISHPNDIRRLLVEQVTGRVRWRETMDHLVEVGVNRVWELGAGKVLSGLYRRADRDASVFAVNGPDDVPKAWDDYSAANPDV